MQPVRGRANVEGCEDETTAQPVDVVRATWPSDEGHRVGRRRRHDARCLWTTVQVGCTQPSCLVRYGLPFPPPRRFLSQCSRRADCRFVRLMQVSSGLDARTGILDLADFARCGECRFPLSQQHTAPAVAAAAAAATTTTPKNHHHHHE